MAIYLKITEDNKNKSVRVGARPIFIGRSSKCHITLNDNMVSGKHLAIKINADQHVVIKDLNTTNGTYLNGNKIDESLLYIDDFIQVGRVKISLLPKEMTSQELKIHQRDFERTNVTFVKLGNRFSGLDDDDENENGISKQRTLLAKIREKNKQGDSQISSKNPQETEHSAKQVNIVFDKDNASPNEIDTEELPDPIEDSIEVDTGPDDKKKPKAAINKEKLKKEPDDLEENEEEDDDEYVDEEEEEADGLVSKIKGLFKR